MNRLLGGTHKGNKQNLRLSYIGERPEFKNEMRVSSKRHMKTSIAIYVSMPNEGCCGSMFTDGLQIVEGMASSEFEISQNLVWLKI